MRAVTVKRSPAAPTSVRELAIYAGSSKVDMRFVCKILPGEERTFDTGEGEGMIFAILEGEENKILAECELENSAQIPKFTLRCKDLLSETPEFEFILQKKQTASYGLIGGIKREIVVALGFVLAIAIGLGSYYAIQFWRSHMHTEVTYFKGNMSITLTDSFTEVYEEGLYAAYTTADGMCALVMREDLSENPILRNYDMKEYCELIKRSNAGIGTNSETMVRDGLTYFTYISGISGDEYKYSLYVYSSDDAYWFVQFGGPMREYEYWERSIQDWASAIKFN